LAVPPTDAQARLREGLAQLELPASAAVVDSLVRFLVLLEKWNRAFNLTAITGLDEMATRHVLDSATALPFVAGASVVDVGSGGGLPGIPLALLSPDREVALLESSAKKAGFLRQAVATVPVSNARVVEDRAERHRPERPFDTVTCRALSSLAEFVATAGHLAAPGGRLVALKGRDPAEELAAVPAPWRGTITPVRVPGLDAQRHIVVLER
jgi:16S rRNA (guanine527-N7)-methyltransferase